MVTIRTCLECMTVKLADQFGFQRAICKSCARERARKWDRENAEKCNVARRKRYSANPEKEIARTAEWYETNRLRVKARNAKRYQAQKEKLLAQTSAWRKANKHVKAALEKKRQAKKLRATPAWADDAKMIEFYFAADFLSMITGEWYQVDHIVPLVSKRVCGLHCEQNLQVLTRADNLRKSNSIWPDMA